MTLTLNDLWTDYNLLLQSSLSTDITRKMSALNIGQRYLVERMYVIGKMIDEFRSDPTNMANTINKNYVDCPTDFINLISAWYRTGTQFQPFGMQAFISYSNLLRRTGVRFFDTTVNSTPQNIAVKEPRIYFDQHFNNTFTSNETITGATSGATGTVDSVSGTTLTYTAVSGSFQDGEVIEGSISGTLATISSIAATTMTIAITGGTKEIKIEYNKRPADMVYYDQLNLTGILGTFQVGENIEASLSNSTATILTVESTYLTINNRDGSFDGSAGNPDVITGATSGATGTVSSLSQLPQSLVWTEKYKTVLLEAATLIWLHLKSSNGVAPRSDIVDGLIEQLSTINRNNESLTWYLLDQGSY
jgi:hypothetical protein